MTKSITLTKGKFALVDDEDFEKLNKHKWCFDGQYAQRRENKKAMRMHRVILDVPDGMMVDHIDGNKLNNQKTNLRICTNAENTMNRQKGFGVSRYKGVALHKKTGKFRAYIRGHGKQVHLGLFEVEEDAARAYDEAAKKYFGEFAKVNL